MTTADELAAAVQWASFLARPIPDEALQRLWLAVKDRFTYGHPVRTEAIRMAQTAALRRLGEYGMEGHVDRYGARDLLQLIACCRGIGASMLVRAAFTRAMVDQDDEVLEVFARERVFPEGMAWYAWVYGLDPSRAAAELDALASPEERSAARLIVARRHPELLRSEWFAAIPEDLPLIAARLAQVAAVHRPDLHAFVLDLLDRRHDVVLAIDPDLFFVPIVRQASEAPQKVLARFEGFYGEDTMVAAAAWHLEHQEPQHAIELAGRVRWLSRNHDQAQLILGLAHLQRDDVARAHAAWEAIDDPAVGRQLLLRLAQRDRTIPTERVVAEAAACDERQPETFFLALQVLLARRDLAAARRAIQGVPMGYHEHPVLGPVIRTIACGREVG